MKLIERTLRGGKYRLTSPFGWRRHPISKVKTFHAGTDYGTYGRKLPLKALEEGVVIGISKLKTGYGNSVWIRYPRLQYSLLYAHLDSISVRKGQKTTADTLIGNVGTTGSSTGIHLHMGVQPIGSNTWMDPEKIKYYLHAKPVTIAYYPVPKYTGSSISEALKSVGITNSFANRKKIAVKNGIAKYSGTMEQNIKLMILLKRGKLKK